MENNSEATKDVSESSRQETVETQSDAQTQPSQTHDESIATEADKEVTTETETEDGQDKERTKKDKSKQLLFVTEDGQDQANLGKERSSTAVAETDDVNVKKSKSNIGRTQSALAAAEMEGPDARKSRSSLGRTQSALIAGEIEGADVSKSKSSLGRLRSDELRRSRVWSRTRLAVGSVISITGQGTDRVVFERRGPRYMNTYKLWSDNPFNPEKVMKILELVMTEAFEELTYDPDLCLNLGNKAKLASASIRQRVKELEFDRYKIISVVTIGERNCQDILVTAKGLWDVERDRYAFYTIENPYLFGIAQCYGLYYE